MSDSGTTPPPPPDQNPYGQPPQASQPYGQPTGQPYGQPYGQPTGQPYGQPGAPAPGQPYGQPGVPAYAGAPVPYASWIRRVGAYVVDYLLTMLVGLPGYGLLIAGAIVGSKDMTTTTYADGTQETTGDWNSGGTVLLVIGGILFLAPIAFAIWNTFVKQGRTGYSIGKGMLGIKLIGEATGQPIGAGMAFVRQLCHILDSFCYIGYLWPLWDAKRQTFADKILKTVVIVQPKP